MSNWVFITGTSRGIGRQILLDIMEKYPDFSVHGLQRNPSQDDSILQKKYQGRLKFTYFDLKDFTKARDLFNSMCNTPEFPSILVNNAAIYTGGNFPVYSSEEIFRINFYAPKFLGEEFIRTTKKPVKIINISSGMGELRGFSRDASLKLTSPDLKMNDLENSISLYLRNASIGWPPDPYSASKGALNTLTRIWNQFFPERTTCISVCPGWVRTDMGGQSAPRSIAEGADTPVWAIVERDIKKGFFYRNRKVVPW